MYRVDVIEVVDSFTYQDPQDDFHREPFIAHFKIKNKSFDFILVTIHTDPDEATDEINKIPETINYADNKVTSDTDVIVLGDLNADCPRQGKYFDEDDSTSPMRADKYTWLISNDMVTNMAVKKCTYDRIIITESAK